MKLSIKNVAKVIDTREICFDGITLLAGTNNTGKSTVSKILYCVFSTLHEIDKQIYNLKKQEIEEYVDSIFGFYFSEDELVDDLYSVILQERDLNKCREILQSLDFKHENKNDLINSFIDRIKKNILEISEHSLKNEIGYRHFNSEFNTQFASILNNGDGSVILKIKNNEILFDVNSNGDININDSQFKILHRAYYYDGPLLVDLYANRASISSMRVFTNHQGKLYRLLKPNNGLIENINNKERANAIFNKYFDTSGEFSQLQIKFRDKFNKYDNVNIVGAKEPLRVERLSSGLKTIMVIYNLFCNSIVDEDILILDEPEINLHPDWQIKLAELLVELRNEFKLTLLISTHSPYFINAIDTYSYKYNVQDKCNYYLASNRKFDGVEYSYFDKIDNIDDIYLSLSEPFERLYSERISILNG